MGKRGKEGEEGKDGEVVVYHISAYLFVGTKLAHMCMLC